MPEKKPDLMSRVGVAIFAIGLLVLIGNAYAYDQDATSWWTFDDANRSGAAGVNILDVALGNNDGTNVGADNCTGVWNQALDFVSANNDRVEVGDKANLSSVDGNASWCAWYQPDGIGVDSYIMGKYNWGGTQREYAVAIESGGNTIQCSVYDESLNRRNHADSASGVSANILYYICCTWDDTAQNISVWTNYSTTMYLNGSNTVVAGIVHLEDTTADFDIGQRSDNVFRADGMIDEPFWVNRTLSYTEITALFQYNNFSSANSCNFSWDPAYPIVSESNTQINGSYTGSVPDNWWYTYVTDGGTATGQNVTHVFTNHGPNNVTLVCNFSNVNFTVSHNVSVNRRPEANYTITNAAPYFALFSIQFNDTSTDPDGDNITNWYWDFGDGNSSTTQNATNVFVAPGRYNVSLIVTDNKSANSTLYSTNVTINGFRLDVFDEKTFAAIGNWSMTVQNATYSRTFSNQSNTFLWDNFSAFPTGPITISLSASGYVGRNYYRTYNLGTYVNMNGYLLATADGLFSYFIVQDALGAVLPDVTLRFQFLNGSSWITAGETQTDDTGSASMWLDWTKSYTVTASKTGYTPISKTFTPQPITYYIVMGSASVFEFESLNGSMWTVLLPTNPEVNATSDSIVMAVFDPGSGISICGLNLTFTNGTVFNSTNVTTEATLCTNTIALATSGLGGELKFYAVPWFTAAATGDYNWTRLYNVLGSSGSSVDSAIEGLKASWGDEALLMFAIFATLVCGAAAAFWLGSGATLVMLAVSGIFFYYGFFGAFAPLWFIAVVAGLAALYIERRRY